MPSSRKCPEPHLTLRTWGSLTGVQRRTRTQLMSLDLLPGCMCMGPGDLDQRPRLSAVLQLLHLALVSVMMIQHCWESEDHIFTFKVVFLLPFLHQLSTASHTAHSSALGTRPLLAQEPSLKNPLLKPLHRG